MSYSSDLRKRVLNFIEAGGSKVEAAKRFGVARTTIYQWLNAPDPLAYQRPGPRGLGPLTMTRLNNILQTFQTRPLASERVTLAFRRSVYGMV